MKIDIPDIRCKDWIWIFGENKKISIAAWGYKSLKSLPKSTNKQVAYHEVQLGCHFAFM
ncbi:hypothetical protein GLYMA_20G210000v4 [Glycine max]|uniref:Uncharacterized protein n=1 Tax=Glycine max TaxID=3847 RepID=K7N4T4_SOYBN|nr:hypothetical protein GYH30_056555 [Glycine max]KRG92421.1 hypothetical protein GLYMA_20G210000v4 [Glycine max]